MKDSSNIDNGVIEYMISRDHYTYYGLGPHQKMTKKVNIMHVNLYDSDSISVHYWIGQSVIHTLDFSFLDYIETKRELSLNKIL